MVTVNAQLYTLGTLVIYGSTWKVTLSPGPSVLSPHRSEKSLLTMGFHFSSPTYPPLFSLTAASPVLVSVRAWAMGCVSFKVPPSCTVPRSRLDGERLML